MKASSLTHLTSKKKRRLVSFQEGTLEEQRAYVWNYISLQTCLYVDWNGNISRYNRPPPLPYTLLISEQKHCRTLRIINHLIDILDIHVLVFDPFQSIQNQYLPPLFGTISQLAHTKNIIVFFLLALQQAPIIQAEVYIDPRR